MTPELRNTGISIVGDVPWGTHFCHFYESQEDLLDILIPYFKAGLENSEFCVWVVSDPLDQNGVRNGLRQAVPEADRYLAAGRIEIVPDTEWYLKDGAFIAERVMADWNEKLAGALAQGYAGLRANGSGAWLTEENRTDFVQYEKTFAEKVADQRMIVLCSYPLSSSSAAEIFDIGNMHQLALLRRRGSWEVLETPELTQAKQEIKRLNEELEQRVIERTSQLAATNEELRKEITERERAEMALRRSEDNLRLVIDTIPVMAWTVEPDGAVDFINQRWLDYTGLTWKQYVQNPNGAIHPDDAPGAAEKWNANKVVGEPYEQEMRLQRADGEYRWFLVRVEPLRDEQGSLVKWYGISIDIEESRKAEALLHAKEQEFRAIVENAPDQIIRYDREFRRVYVNPAVAKAYGLPAEALIGKPMGSVIEDAGLDVKENELAQVRQWIAAVFDTGESYEHEFTWPVPAGRRYFSVRLFPEFSLDGAVINVLGISRDITERKLAEEELKKEKEILEKIFDNIPVMIGFVGDGGVKLVNPEWERTIGWTLKELQDQDVDIFVEAYPDPEYRQEVLDFVAASTGEWADLKISVRDGRVIDAACAIVRLSDGTRVAIAQDITERKLAVVALDERLRFETLVTELSAAFANVSPNEVDREIERCLQTLVEFLGVDRASFFQFNEDWTTLYRSHSYTAPGIKPLPPTPIGMIEQFPWITDQLRRGVTVKWARIPDDMPEAAAKEKEYAAQHGVKSGLNIPVLMGGSVICAITFTSIVAYRDWPDAMVARLRLVGEIFAAAVERKQAEERLKQSERQLAEAQRLAHIGSWDWDLRTNAVTWSDELYHIFGLQPGTISVAGEVDRFIHPDDLALGWDTVKRAVASKEPYDYYHRILRPDGTERIARSRGSIMSDERGEPIRVFGATQDVTDLKRAEDELKATTEQMRALSARLQSAREEESKRIAREIHDELGGALTTWKWDLEEIREGISEPLGSSQVSALQTKIDGMIKVTETTLDTVRKLASELRPMALELGLIEAIEWEAAQFKNRTGIAVNLEGSLEKVSLNHEQSTAVFRIFQEALTNILRHAQATKVTITVKEEPGQFFLTISDDGRGIPETEQSGRQSLGLLGMRERAHLAGGEINIESIEGEGTRITVQIPLSTG